MVPERRWRQAAAGAASVMLVAAAVSFSGGAARPGELVSIGVRLGAEQRMDLRQAVELGRSEKRFTQAKANLKVLYGELNGVYAKLQLARQDEGTAEAAIGQGGEAEAAGAGDTETYQSALRGWKVLGALDSATESKKKALGGVAVSVPHATGGVVTPVPQATQAALGPASPTPGASANEHRKAAGTAVSAGIEDDTDSAISALLDDISKGSGLKLSPRARAAPAPSAGAQQRTIAQLRKEVEALKEQDAARAPAGNSTALAGETAGVADAKRKGRAAQ